MNLIFSLDCPIFDPLHSVDLHAILRTMLNDMHSMTYPSSEILREKLSHEFEPYMDYLLRAEKLSAYRAPKFTKPSNCSACDPRRLANYLMDPLEVLVENARTDGGFIKFAARVHAKGMLEMSLNGNRGVVFRHGGGITEVEKEVERLAAFKPPPPDGLPIRAFVLVDSDSDVAGRISRASKRVVKACTKHGFQVHVLQKRSIENYLSALALTEYARIRTERQAGVTTVITLSESDWDVHNIKAHVGDFMADFLDVVWRFQPDAGYLRDADDELLGILTHLEEML